MCWKASPSNRSLCGPSRCFKYEPHGPCGWQTMFDYGSKRCPGTSGLILMEVTIQDGDSHFVQHGHRGVNVLGDGLVMVGPKLGGEPQKFKIFSAGNWKNQPSNLRRHHYFQTNTGRSWNCVSPVIEIIWNNTSCLSGGQAQACPQTRVLGTLIMTHNSYLLWIVLGHILLNITYPLVN